MQTCQPYSHAQILVDMHKIKQYIDKMFHKCKTLFTDIEVCTVLKFMNRLSLQLQIIISSSVLL